LKARLTQRALASASRITQPEIAAIERGRYDPGVTKLSRLIQATGGRLGVIPGRSVADNADVIRDALTRDDHRFAYRALVQSLDDINRWHGANRVAVCTEPPTPTGDRRYDAYLAALTEHLLGLEHLPIPEWVNEPDRFLSDPWLVAGQPSLYSAAVAASPESFRRHGVLINEGDLASV
jgi:transcriptional regulator with XRE-family HTH domain